MTLVYVFCAVIAIVWIVDTIKTEKAWNEYYEAQYEHYGFE